MARLKRHQWPSIDSVHRYWRAAQRPLLQLVDPQHCFARERTSVFYRMCSFDSKQTTILFRGRERETGPGPIGCLVLETKKVLHAWPHLSTTARLLHGALRGKEICEAARSWWLAPSVLLVYQGQPETWIRDLSCWTLCPGWRGLSSPSLHEASWWPSCVLALCPDIGTSRSCTESFRLGNSPGLSLCLAFLGKSLCCQYLGK